MYWDQIMFSLNGSSKKAISESVANFNMLFN